MKKSTSWSAQQRNDHIQKAKNNSFDMIIIGGGITGAGVAREAALRGISFCLIDKNDFAFGTSSRSSKLAHGGMRYLSQGEFDLVRESTTERNWLRVHFPNLVRPQGFITCSFENSKDTPELIKAGIEVYDELSDKDSKFINYRKSQVLSPDEVKKNEPAFTQSDPELGKLLMAGFHYDNNVDDSRLTLETIKESLDYSNGASVAINYTLVSEYIRDDQGKINGVKVDDQLGNMSLTIKAKVVVSCTGIWTDELMQKAEFSGTKIYPTKGVHVVVPNERLGNKNGFGIKSFDDSRFFFVLRRGPASLIGTTDTDYFKESKNLDEPWCTKQDCDYLFRTVNRMFPEANLTYADIIGTYAGIRPLVKEEGTQNESAVSRKHEIFESKDGLVAIAGGKLTTYRLMAEELLFYLVEKKYLPPFKEQGYGEKCFSQKSFKVGITREDFDRIAAENSLVNCSWPEQLEYLHQQYGKQGLSILESIKANPETGKPLFEEYPYCKAEIDFILENENAPCLIDVLCRRTEAQWMIWHYKQKTLAEKVADIMAGYYGWSKERKKAEIEHYTSYIKKTIWF